jgi:hypothetical protein
MSPRKMSAFSILGLQHVAKFASEKIEICNDAIVLRPMDRRFGGISIGENFSHQEMPHCSPGVGICPMLIHMDCSVLCTVTGRLSWPGTHAVRPARLQRASRRENS